MPPSPPDAWPAKASASAAAVPSFAPDRTLLYGVCVRLWGGDMLWPGTGLMTVASPASTAGDRLTKGPLSQSGGGGGGFTGRLAGAGPRTTRC